jgi:hypothetical protein
MPENIAWRRARQILRFFGSACRHRHGSPDDLIEAARTTDSVLAGEFAGRLPLFWGGIVMRTVLSRSAAALVSWALLGALGVGLLAPEGLVPAVQAAPAGRGTAAFVLVNNTSTWLSLYIDGSRSVSVPPRDRGVDYVKVGFHNFKAVTLDNTGRSVSRSGNIGPGGMTWTIDER